MAYQKYLQRPALVVDRERVDVARAAIHAFWFSSKSPEPIHITKLSGFFRKYYPTESAADVFQLLQWLQEAIELPEGYWLPAPSLAVSFRRLRYLITPHPSSELRRHFQMPVRLATFGRFIEGDVPRGFNLIEKLAWLNRPQNTDAWLSTIFNSALVKLRPTTDASRELQVFRSWRNPTSRSDSFRTWTDGSVREAVPNGLHLVRERSGLGMLRFFVGSFRAGELTEEAEIRCDFRRLRFAMDKRRGIRLPLRVHSDGDVRIFELRTSLPVSETRLLLSVVAGVEQIENGYRLTVESDLFEDLRDVLEDLGFEVKDS